MVPACGAVPAVGHLAASVRRTPDKRGSRWVPSVPLGLAAGAFPAPQRCHRDVAGAKHDLARSGSFWLLDFEIDEIAIHVKFTDQGIDLTQKHLWMRAALEVTAHETVFVHADVESSAAGISDGRRSVFLH